jgi:macrophage erythroblast attacher
MDLEHPFIKAPYESLNKIFRNSQKVIEKEISQVISSVNEIHRKKDQISKEEAYQTLDKLVTKLQSLKRKLQETNKEEQQLIQRCKTRLEHLDMISDVEMRVTNGETQRRWYKIRLDRIMVDYLLREGFYNTAIMLAKDSNITELVDIDIFLAAKKVVDTLSKGDCKEALKWCVDNRSKLKKINSKLEFKLRLQEFIELVRTNSLMDAIDYSRKHLSPFAETHLKEIQIAMATLAFRKETTCDRYKELFEINKWKELVNQFQSDNNEIYNLTSQSLLTRNLTIGLSALKTWNCYNPQEFIPDCPICTPSFRILAKDVPVAHHTHSNLVCRISKENMNDDNPPMVLPNGYAYGFNALCEMADNNGGKITCPRTGQVFDFDQLRKAFIS